MLAHETPLTPITDHVPVPVGTAPPVAPVTVAVKVKVEPSVALLVEVITATPGVSFVIVTTD